MTQPLSEYEYVDQPSRLVFFTILRVLKTQHLLLSPFHFHANFTQPQRLVCLLNLLLSILAMNALVYGIPDSIALLQQYASTGVLTAFLTFPIYCFTILLFSSRSIPPSKRLVKRRYLASDVQFASERVREMERLSSMYPSLPPPARPPTNLQRPAKLPGIQPPFSRLTTPKLQFPPATKFTPTQSMIPPINFKAKNLPTLPKGLPLVKKPGRPPPLPPR